MKKILFGFLLFCILGVSQIFATSQVIDYGVTAFPGSNYSVDYSSGSLKIYTGSTLIIQLTGPKLNGSTIEYIFIGSSSPVRTFVKFTDTSWVVREGTSGPYTNSGPATNTTGFYQNTSTNEFFYKLYSFGTSHGRIYGTSYQFSSSVSTTPTASYFPSFQGIIVGNTMYESGPLLECETYTETQTISTPGFTINSYLTGSDTTSLFEEYDAAYTEIYDEMIVNYFDFQTLSTESFSTTGATFLGITFPLKYPTLSFSAYNSDDADYTIHDGFIFTGGVLNNPPNISENSFEYIKIRDGNDKEIFLDEIIQGKKYMIPGGVKDVEFKFKRSWYQVFDTNIIFDFQFINYADIEVEKTFCKNPQTGEGYIDGVLTDYTDIDDVPKTSSDIEIVQGDMPSEPSVDSWTGTTSTISLETFGASYETDPKCSVDNSKYKWDSYDKLALVDKVFCLYLIR